MAKRKAIDECGQELESGDALERLVRGFQTRSRDRLMILTSLGIFDEIRLYAIVSDYVVVECQLSPMIIDAPEARKAPDVGTPIVGNVHDRVGTMAFSEGITGFRFCFPTVPTFVWLNGHLDIGVTTRSVPYPYPDKFIYRDESAYLTIPIRRNPPPSELPYLKALLVDDEQRYNVLDVTAPVTNRIAYIDLCWNREQKAMVVKIAHSACAKSTALEFIISSRHVANLMDTTLYPFLSSRRPLDVSIHLLEDAI